MQRTNKLIAVVGLTAALLSGVAVSALAGPPEKVTICHAAGQEGTTHFVTLNLPYNAVYGQAGHFNENGTTQAGHEADYEGACLTPTTTTTTSVVTTTVVTTTEPPGPPVTITGSTTTTEPPTTTSSSTTTTTVGTTTSTAATSTTSTTKATTTTSTVPPTTTTTEPAKELPLTGPEDLLPIALAGGGLLLLGSLALRRTGFGDDE